MYTNNCNIIFRNMNLLDHKCLIQTRLIFIEKVDFDQMKDHLIQEEIITVDEKDEILKCCNLKAKSTKLHDLLLRSNDGDMFEALCEVRLHSYYRSLLCVNHQASSFSFYYEGATTDRSWFCT